MLLLTDQPKDALTLFKENAEGFPDNVTVFTDLGEGYAENGDMKNAVASFEKALKVDPNNFYAIEVLRHIKE